MGRYDPAMRGGGARQLVARDVDVDDLRQAALRVGVSPFNTLFIITSSAVGRAGLVPAETTQRVRRRLRDRDRAVLAPIDASVARALPDLATGMLEPGIHTLDEELSRIASTPVEVFEGQISRLGGSAIAPGWDEAARQPRRWIARYVDALSRVWPVVEPLWYSAQRRVMQEVERVAVAAALGAQTELLTGLWPGSRVSRGRFIFDADGRRWPEHVQLANQSLVVLPWIGTAPHRIIGAEPGPTGRLLRDLAYAIPGGLPAAGAEQRPDALEALLGTQRTRILRALRGPLTMSGVADALTSVPSAATHQVSALEAADLVARRRQGRHVVVQRTERGHQLLELYE